jgi:hypothetical protein
MKVVGSGVAMVALMLSAGTLAAQQPSPPSQGMHEQHQAGMKDHMQMMDSANAHLDSLVARMNHTTGAARVTAMADVINELVAQRASMQEHMHAMMMGGHDGMMPGMRDSMPARRHAPTSRPGSAAADTAHADHHPSD